MPLFDPHTNKILLEAASKPPRVKRRYGLVGKPARTLSSSGPSRITAGGGGSGVGITGGSSRASMSTPWAGTPAAPGTAMPSGSDIVSQGYWGNVAANADSVLNHYLGWVPDPLIKSGAKQLIKTELAARYLGGMAPTTGLVASLGAAGPAASAAIRGTTAIASMLGLSPTVAGMAGVPTGRFGRLGIEVSAKLPQLAMMGIDPLDWATKAFGAQSALSHMANIGSQTAAAAVGAGGYLERGKRKGIY
jgi:hypothetical protein